MFFGLHAADDSLLALQRKVSAKALMDETQAVQRMLEELPFLAALDARIQQDTYELVTKIRSHPAHGGVEAFLQEYGLDSEEGVAIMCLAEALLRIPDADTADRLIHDTFEDGDWEKHLGHSDSLFVNASSWGLLLTGKVVRLSDTQDGLAPMLARLVGKLGEPVIRETLKAAMRHIGSQFVLGETIEDALSCSADWEEQQYRFSYDMLGEGARSDAQAQVFLQSYLHALTRIAGHAKSLTQDQRPSLSVKLSALHPRYQLLQHERVMTELLPRVKQIMLAARDHDIAVSIDAEEAARLDIQLLLFTELFLDPDFSGWNDMGFVVQAYQRRGFYVIDTLLELARRTGRKMPIRLVKGAYWDTEIKAAQVAGLTSYPVFTRKEHTDISYMACAGKILSHIEHFFPQFATHNARTLCSVLTLAQHYNVGKTDFEFQRLHGMGDALYRIVSSHYPCRIYAPVGEHKDLLAYLIRRLLENGANTSFVHLLMNEETPVEELLQDPIAKARAHGVKPHPDLPSPLMLYGTVRRNSAGIDLGNLAACEALEASLSAIQTPPVMPAPTPPDALDGLMQQALHTWNDWQSVSVEERCAMLEQAADRFEKSRDACIALLMEEGGKTLADCVAEVRETIDFCRYYAAQARILFANGELSGPTGESNRLLLAPRGVFACISPWNFPLAIFTGQIAAALVTGNCVIAKPAEQTPRMAVHAVRILHEAGIPKSVLQLVIGDGKTGAALVAHPQIAGVAFTGSVEAAQHINRALAQRTGPIVPLIAETGGQNCMVVDSSALLETAVDDIVLSAFGSAGQRCSALRVLFVQEDIADALIALLAGAMQELRIGNPQIFATDTGPVIDEEAQSVLLAHIERMQQEARLVAASPVVPDASGHFVTPHAFEIRSITQLEKEVFGPILHIIRFKSDTLQDVADAINSTGYGLTFGIHSRIGEQVDFFAERIRAGNMYVNRSMIGATVGVQPFGGEGLSGTGPKAGGPYTLLRFVTERSISVNTAAIGGNVALLIKA